MNGSMLNRCVAAFTCALLGACSTHQATFPEQREFYQLEAASSGQAGHAAAETAASLVGSPYRYGGHGPSTFDCSGLVYYSYRSAGYRVPRTSRQQYQAAKPIPLAQARAGDLLFFSYEEKVSHVGIYLGDQQFVHAPATGKSVSVASLRDEHYRQHFVSAGRLVGKP